MQEERNLCDVERIDNKILREILEKFEESSSDNSEMHEEKPRTKDSSSNANNKMSNRDDMPLESIDGKEELRHAINAHLDSAPKNIEEKTNDIEKAFKDNKECTSYIIEA